MLTDREIFMALVDNDSMQKSDAIVLLEGDGLNRYKHAVWLYKQKWAPVIVFSGGIINLEYGSFPFDKIKPLLLENGVLEKDLYHESQSLHTRQQAEEIVKMSSEFSWKRIILVASHYHQYRAFLTFLKVVLEKKEKLIIYNSPERNLSWFTLNPWGDRLSCLRKEFDRIEEYTLLGHVASYKDAINYQQWKEQLLIK